MASKSPVIQGYTDVSGVAHAPVYASDASPSSPSNSSGNSSGKLPSGVAYQTYNPDGSVKASYTKDQKAALDASSGDTPTTPTTPTTPDTGSPAQTPTPPANPQQTGQLSYNQALQNLNAGGLTGNALQQAQASLANSYGQNKFTQAHQQLQGTGPAPSDGGKAMSAVQNATPYEPDQTGVNQVFSQDPVINKLMSNAWDLLSPENTKTSLMDDYKKLRADSGLDQINHEMIDAETIINGTEQDIRNEIQTAGGFGTDSQVQAMALARNKGLLKRYNDLAQMQTNATNQLNTLVNLDAQDRQMAQQKVTAQVSALFNFAQFRQSAQNATQEAFKNLVAKVGYSGAYAAYASHPDQMAQIEKVMGLAPGGLASLAQQPDYDMQLKQMQVQEARSTIAKNNAEIAKTNAETVAATKAKTDAIQNSATTADTVLNSVKDALKQVNPISTGLIGGSSAFIPGLPSSNLQKTIATIKSNLAFTELAKMRAASPTGGALGQISDKEEELLSSTVANLDVGNSTSQLKANLQAVQTHYVNYLKSLGYGYDAATGTVISP